jgi:hypothetical protein
MRRLLFAVLVSTWAGCFPPSTVPVGYYYVPVPRVPLHAYPPAPFHDPYSWWHPPAEVTFQTPSLAVRNLAMRISESASNGDCATAKAAGDELERIDHDAHHAILAVDERYASCIRGF